MGKQKTAVAVSDRTRTALRDHLYAVPELDFRDLRYVPFRPGIDDAVPTTTEDGLVYDWETTRAEVPLDLSGVKLLTQGANMIGNLSKYNRVWSFLETNIGQELLAKFVPSARIEGHALLINSNDIPRFSTVIDRGYKDAMTSGRVRLSSSSKELFERSPKPVPDMNLRRFVDSMKPLDEARVLDEARRSVTARYGESGVSKMPAAAWVGELRSPNISDIASLKIRSHLGSANNPELENPAKTAKQIFDIFYAPKMASVAEERAKMIDMIAAVEAKHYLPPGKKLSEVSTFDVLAMRKKAKAALDDELRDMSIENIRQLYDRIVLNVK